MWGGGGLMNCPQNVTEKQYMYCTKNTVNRTTPDDTFINLLCSPSL